MRGPLLRGRASARIVTPERDNAPPPGEGQGGAGNGRSSVTSASTRPSGPRRVPTTAGGVQSTSVTRGVPS